MSDGEVIDVTSCDEACLSSANARVSGAGADTLTYLLTFVFLCYCLFFVALLAKCFCGRTRRGSPVAGDVAFRQFDTEPTHDLQNKMVAELDQQWRKAFIGKVYTILGMQLFVTTCISALMMIYGGADLARWSRTEGMWAYWLSLIGTFVTLGLTICFRTKSPHNLLLLGLFTLFESYMVGMICSYYAAAGYSALVVEALAITSVIFVALTLFTMQSKINFDFLGVGLGVALLVLLMWGMFSFLFFDSFVMRQMYALGGAVIFALFVVYDTHVVINRLSYDEYILGAINLYLDFINLFLFILQLLTGGRRD